MEQDNQYFKKWKQMLVGQTKEAIQRELESEVRDQKVDQMATQSYNTESNSEGKLKQWKKIVEK